MSCVTGVPCHAQAFFLTGAEELGHWAATHPEYSQEQLSCLAAAVADFKGLKKKERAAFVTQVNASLL